MVHALRHRLPDTDSGVVHFQKFRSMCLFLRVPVLILILSKGRQKPIPGTVILGCVTISTHFKYKHLQKLVLGIAIFG